MYGKQWNIISISNPNWLKRFWKWQKRRFSYFVLTTPKTGKCTTKYHHLKFAIASANIFSAPGHTHTSIYWSVGAGVLCEVLHCSINRSPPARMKSINFDFDNIEWFIVGIFVKEKIGLVIHGTILCLYMPHCLYSSFTKRPNVILLTYYREQQQQQKSIQNVVINVRTLMNSDDNRKGSENEDENEKQKKSKLINANE